MAEYIDREAVMKIAKDGNHSDFGRSMADLTSLRELLEDTPTADVVEVRHSEWKQVIFSDGTKSCKCCMACGTFVEPKYNYKYCPECGAKMDGKGD